MTFDRIPLELRSLNQFVLWKYEDRGGIKPTKVPYSPNGRMASVIDASTWCSFDEAISCVHNYSGLGFVFSINDPYCGIDLDEVSSEEDQARQLKVFQAFNSYSERSPSGKGLHIITRNAVPSGRRRAGIEIYSDSRFFTMTGDVFHDVPIRDGGEPLRILWEQMGHVDAPTYHDGLAPETLSDNEVCGQAYKAVNGQKFYDLYVGNWTPYYDSQSEADFAIIDIIAFYTQNTEQIKRIFWDCELGKRPKAKRLAYLSGMIKRSYDRQLPAVDIEGLANQIETAKADRAALRLANDAADKFPAPVASSAASAFQIFPPGLMGEIAQFIYDQAPRPVREIALAGAIGLMAGVVGRAYNVSGTGLNHYVMLAAKTGRGKEAINSGIGKILTTCSANIPTIMEFWGPGDIASGQALRKHLSNSPTPCFVSVVGEFGIKLKQISSQRASTADESLRRMLLDLWGKSGKHQVLEKSIYSDKQNNAEVVHSPAFSMIGESVPDTLFKALDEAAITNGLLPRFVLIEYNGLRPPINKDHTKVEVPHAVVKRLCDVADFVFGTMRDKKTIDVQLDHQADILSDKLNEDADTYINDAHSEPVAELWNRFHLKVLKLAALVAVGIDPWSPVITLDCLSWAERIIRQDTTAMAARFESGDMGENGHEKEQENKLCEIIKQYVTTAFNELKGAKGQPDMHADKIVPFKYIQYRTIGLSAFKNDKNGAGAALKRTVQSLIDQGSLAEIGQAEVARKYKKGGRAFALADPDKFI